MLCENISINAFLSFFIYEKYRYCDIFFPNNIQIILLTAGELCINYLGKSEKKIICIITWNAVYLFELKPASHSV